MSRLTKPRAQMAVGRRTALVRLSGSLRTVISTVLYPMERLAQVPRFLGDQVALGVTAQRALKAENDALKEQVLMNKAQLSQFIALKSENNRLRVLLNARASLNVSGQLAEITDLDLDPFSHRVVVSFAGQAAGLDSDTIIERILRQMET